MQRQQTIHLILSSSLILATLALFLLIQPTPHPLFAATPRDPAPTILQVDPPTTPNNLDIVMTITGTNFSAAPLPTVKLGSTQLTNLGWISSSVLTATVPWGLNPGTYTVTVTNPDGQFGSLPNAFTVTQAIGVWTTNGPYGGWTNDMAVSPTISRTAFAAVRDVGLFRTQDGSDHWNLALYDAYFAPGVSYGIAPTNTLYFWSGTGLWRSNDDGLTFQQIYTRTISAFAPDPQNAQHLWLGSKFGASESTDGGSKWTPHSTGLITGTNASPALGMVVDPIITTTLYLVYQNGNVFRTMNGGDNWTLLSVSSPSTFHVYRLAINPFAPNVLLFTEAVDGPTYRSEDWGDTWSPVTVTDSSKIRDFVFSPYISGTVYATKHPWPETSFLAISTDGGANWASMPIQILGANSANSGGMKLILGLDPATGLPAYIGTQNDGAWRSRDGGFTWERANNGIAGLGVQSLIATPGSPEIVLAGAASGFASENAGISWRDLNLCGAGCNFAIGPQQPSVIYEIGTGTHFMRSQDGGISWQFVDAPWMTSYGFGVTALEVDPLSSSVVYAGGDDNQGFGQIFRSNDYADTWSPLSLSPVTATTPISPVSDIKVDPINDQIIYVATGVTVMGSDRTPQTGEGIFRSDDGGTTWYTKTNGIGNVVVSSLAINPTQTQTIYAGAWLSSENQVTIFKSTNSGDSWTSTSLRVNGPGGGVTGFKDILLALDPLAPDTLYAGTQYGLYRTTDGGNTWTKAAGGLGQNSITALAAASDNDHTIIYAAIVGGLTAGASPVRTKSSQRVSGYVQGGVYQQTTSHKPMPSNLLFLPLIKR